KYLSKPLIANCAANLGRNEPEFALMLTKAALMHSSEQLLCASTFIKGMFYWPLKTVIKRSRKPKR
ncbi:MAG: hypothetical protein ACW97O_17790, partial [Candidatus Thorarchaeota archaeon]